MNTRTHAALANFIWGICNLLRGPYKRNEYRKVILPLTVLRRFDCVLASTKEAVLAADATYAGQSENVRRSILEQASQRSFYNTSKLDFARLLDDPNHLAQSLSAYIRDFSPNVREIIERFASWRADREDGREESAVQGYPGSSPAVRPFAGTH